MALLVDVGGYLQTGGCGTVAVTIFEGQMPADCDAGLALNEYGGESPDYDLTEAGVHIEYPRLQLFCRHPDYDTGRALIEKAYQLLAKVVNQTIGSTKYMRIEPLQQPFSVNPPQDAQGRWNFFCNFRTEKALG